MEGTTLLITLVLHLLTSTEGNDCPSSVEGYFGQNILIECNFLHPLIGVYWFDETDKDEPLIRLEHGIKAGKGYQSVEYDVMTNGSLVIRDAKWTNDMIYTVVIIDSEYSDHTSVTKVSVHEHCPVNQFGLAEEEATIVCHFKPGFLGVYWFETEGDDEPLIRLEGSHKSGKGLSKQKYDIHNNGSLIIRRVPNNYQNTFFVLLLSINYEEWSGGITFQAVRPCGLLSNPKNGEVTQTGRVAMFICDEGYQLTGSRQRFCIFHETSTWDGNETLCIRYSPPRVTTVRISDASTPRTKKQTPVLESTEGHDEETRPTELPETKSSTKDYGNNLIPTNKLRDITSGNNIPPLPPDIAGEPPDLKDGSHAEGVLRSPWTLVTLMVILCSLL